MLMLSSRRARELLGKDCRLSDEEIGTLVERLNGLANVVVDGFKASPKSVRDDFQPHGVNLVEIAAPSLGSGVPAASSETSPTEPKCHPSTAGQQASVVLVSARHESEPAHWDVERWVEEENRRRLSASDSHESFRQSATPNPE